MSNQLRSLSEVLMFLMVQNKDYLLAQKGKPPQGKCLDCKRDILAMELAARCPKCSESLVCYECVDKHDHLHDNPEMRRLLTEPLLKLRPKRNRFNVN
jgi:Zn finger protein HypA/HybF involved in hydrogenase expression